MVRHDAVVVGAGAAGCVLAARLSEDPARSVLLLEAGPDHDDATTATATALRSLRFTDALAVPGRLWRDLVASRVAGGPPTGYAQGRGVGGSSAINGLVALRGTPEDYDHWAHDLGCPSWAWEKLLPWFLIAEDDEDFGGDGFHGRGGPLPLRRVPAAHRSSLDRAVGDAAASLGYPAAEDVHAIGVTGLSPVPLTVGDGRRWSVADAYLAPARVRANLAVRTGVLVDRVALDGRRVVGIVTSTGEEIEAGEVLLCAGALHSPAVLLRSGIGPDGGLPVGANLIDHAATPGFELLLDDRGQQRGRDGPILSSVLRYSSGLTGAGDNDMQMVWFDALDAGSPPRARLVAAVMRAFSRGEVTLAAADPMVEPRVELRLLSDDRDRVRLRDAVRRAAALLQQPSIGAITVEVRAGDLPLDSLTSDDAIDAWLASAPGDYLHAAGTCRMGTPGDPAAVVDETCRVIGFEHLRVCDASVLPDLPRANPMLTVVAIAEAMATALRS